MAIKKKQQEKEAARVYANEIEKTIMGERKNTGGHVRHLMQAQTTIKNFEKTHETHTREDGARNYTSFGDNPIHIGQLANKMNLVRNQHGHRERMRDLMELKA